VLASAELGELDADKRPTVQIGDPFEENKLLDCSLELLEQGLLVSLQDLGAAG
jgi:phosphoribosylformylglycinamidine synthase